MAKLIFRLRNVPDDEAEEVRQLLQANRIDFYETDAGNWGISMPGLWLNDEDDEPRVKELLVDYQRKRVINARESHDQAVNSGEARTLKDVILQRPFATLGLLLFCLVVVYFSTKPFFTFAR